MNDIHITSEDLIDYLHGELPPERDARIFTHLESCTVCRSARDAEGSLTEALRLHYGVEQELPAMVRARVWEAVRSERPSWLVALRTALRPVIAVPVAVLVAAGVYFTVPVAHPQPSRAGGVSASYYFDQYAAASAQTPLLERTPDFTNVPVSQVHTVAGGAVEAVTLDDESDH